jgi:hypothetical protein
MAAQIGTNGTYFGKQLPAWDGLLLALIYLNVKLRNQVLGGKANLRKCRPDY